MDWRKMTSPDKQVEAAGQGQWASGSAKRASGLPAYRALGSSQLRLARRFAAGDDAARLPAESRGIRGNMRREHRRREKQSSSRISRATDQSQSFQVLELV